jgi:Carboxypeptidase regulatory-like domain
VKKLADHPQFRQSKIELTKIELMKLACACLLIVLSGPAEIFAQSLSVDPNSSSAPAHPSQASVAGFVTKEPASEPVKKALIELIAESQNDGGGNYTAVTGPDGSFHIENVAPGRYRLFVERTGYQEIDKHRRRAEGRVITLTAGQEMKDLLIRLQAAAVVEGRVTDEDGDPIADAQVAVLHQTFVSGHGHWEQVGAERSNDLGEYRIAGLAAGNYFVSVTPPPDFRSLIETSGNGPAAVQHPPDKPAPATYQTTYYPGTRDRTQAASIQLHAGDDFPVNFSLTPAPSLIIRGSVVNVPPGAMATVTLQSKDLGLMLNGAEIHKDGSFEIRDVSPGAYTIVASVDSAAVPMTAREPLHMAANVEGLRLVPQTGGSIRGRLRMEVSGKSGIDKSRSDPSQIFLQLHSIDDDDASGTFATEQDFFTVAHVNFDGTFEWKNVPAGRYSVQLSGASAMPDWFLKSVVAGGRDVADSGFSVSGGVTLDVVASANGATVEGIAANDKNESVADAVVVAVPEARFRSHSNRYRKAVSDQSGHFTLRGLPPGDYTILAWESIDGEAYYNPEFLKAYEGQGKALHLTEGDHATAELKTIPATEDQQ